MQTHMTGVIDQEYRAKRTKVAGILSELEKDGEWKMTITRRHPEFAAVKETKSQMKLETQ